MNRAEKCGDRFPAREPSDLLCPRCACSIVTDDAKAAADFIAHHDLDYVEPTVDVFHPDPDVDLTQDGCHAW